MVLIVLNISLLLFIWGVHAEVTLVNSLGATFITTKAYSPQLASRLNFDPITGPAYFAGDLCFEDVEEKDFPSGAIIFYARTDCDDAVPLNRFIPFSNKVGAVVELFGSKEAVVDRTALDPDPNDAPPRFSFDPNPAKENLNYIRAHGSDAGAIARYLAAVAEVSGATVNATVTYVSDPWKAMYYTPQWIIYEAVVILFFCVYITQHAVRSVIYVFRMRRRSPLHSRSTGLDLQLAMMIAALFLGIVRIVEYTTQTMRDYGDIWTPEIVSQLAWGYGYVILLLSLLLLVLYWADVLKTSKVKMVMIERLSSRIFITIGVLGFIALTVFIVLFVYQLPGTSFVRSAGFLILGVVALFESLGTMFYGGKLLKQLTDVKPVAARGGGSFTQRPISPSITAPASEVCVDNPAFDPEMNSVSPASNDEPRVSSKTRFSLPKALSSKQPLTGSEDNSVEEKRKIRIAQKRAKPLTRLVFASALLLFAATCISAAATFTPVLSSPDTYIVVFALLVTCEIIIYSLVIQTMSPIWQTRRRRFARAETESQLSPLSEDGVVRTNSQRSRCGRVKMCISNWCVC